MCGRPLRHYVGFDQSHPQSKYYPACTARPSFTIVFRSWQTSVEPPQPSLPDATSSGFQFFDAVGLHAYSPEGSGLNPLGLLTPHWIIQLVIDRNAIENL